jgi:hypothetical protein
MGKYKSHSGYQANIDKEGGRVPEAMKLKLNSVASVRERTIPTERSPLVAEVSVNFCGYRVLRGQRNGFPRSLVSVFLTGAANIYSE